MQRRDLLKSAAAFLTTTTFGSASALSALLESGSAAAAGLKPLGKPEPFDYAALKGKARTLCSQPWEPVKATIPPALANLDWDHWQAIQYKPEHSLWADQGLRTQLRFFHLGWHMVKPVQMYEVVDGQAQQLAYDPEMFDHSRSGINSKALPKDLGFAGFRVLFHTDKVRDIAAFQGASYFRAIDGDNQYGMSARGLAVDCGLDPEEFPDFTTWWLERPAKDSSRFTIYALLDSKSVTGAYRFIIDLADTIVMDIDSALYPRRPIERLGIAPLTAMYQCGENDRRVGNDWRYEIHDADGLQIQTGWGEWLWRPLVNPAGIRVNSYYDDSPKGFGLLQRDRQFDHYQDDGVFYEKRPSLWVEPKTAWGKGAIQLVELSTPDETNDNIVAFWNPTEKPQPGQELLFGYKLYWCRKPPMTPNLATVRATRTGIGGVIGHNRQYFSWRFAVDFAGGDFGLLGGDAKVEAVIEASRGTVELTSARPLWQVNGESSSTGGVSGWRAMFDIKPTDDSIEPINLKMVLRCNGQVLTESWLYQWTPPPVDQRRV